jgi:hypothetical protein
MLVEKLLGLLFIIVIGSLFIFQYLVPKIVGIETFPMFRKRPRVSPPVEKIRSDLMQVDEDLMTTDYEKTLKERRQLLVERRSTLTESPIESK